MGIHFLVSNENIQNLFYVGFIGTGYNSLVGPIIIMLKEEDVEVVQELLSSSTDHVDYFLFSFYWF
ncbi:MAG: hypothetical protein JW870_18940 [Candidatus Delongbacteria bacterium]|nr:hypothetical protein [Candidatus Delongbacteria bacterium]